jgi:hypothetical protein
MNTNELIRRFIDEGAGRPLLHPMQQSALWIAGILAYLFIFLFFDGFRPGIAEKLALPGFMIELVMLFLVATSASFAAFCLSRPDGFQLPWIKFMPIPLLFIWAVVAFANEGDNLSLSILWNSIGLGQFDCPLHILLFSILPGVVIFFLVRMGATIRYYWAGAMSTLSVTAFAYLFMRLVENNDNPAHLIIWHALPISLICLVGMFAGRKAFRWS